MSIFSKIKYKKFREYVDIIEWVNGTSDNLIWRFPRYKAEIKNGAKLTVGKSQVAVLVSDGQFADIYQPGTHELTTVNMPVLATLKRWKHGFNSPFKADIYFVNTKQYWNINWATKKPIVMHDSEFKSIHMHASGLYCFQVKTNPIKFIRNVVGTDRNFTAEGISDQLLNFVIEKFTDYITTSKITVFDLASNLNEFSSELTIALKTDYSEYGLNLMKFSVDKVILPEDVKKVFDKRIKKDAIKNNNSYTQTLFGDSFRNASSNIPNNAIASGIGLDRAKKMAQEMMDSRDGKFAPTMQSDTSVHANSRTDTPPPIPHQTMYYIAIGGVQQGPFQQTELQKMVQQAKLTPNTLVWTMGMANWQAAQSVPSLSQLFGTVPPPL